MTELSNPQTLATPSSTQKLSMSQKIFETAFSQLLLDSFD